MPLVTRQANQGVIFRQLLEPGEWLNGDLWSDTTDSVLKLNNNGTAENVGQTSFSSSATVTFSETIGDYIQPDAATATSAATTTDTITQSSSNASENMNGAGRERLAITLTGTSSLVGYEITQATAFFSKTNSPTGTLRCRIRESDNTIRTTSATTFDVSTFTGSFVAKVFPLTNTILASGDRITFEFAESSGSDFISIQIDTTDPFDGTNTFESHFIVSTWTDETGNDLKFILDSDLTASASNAVDDNTTTFWESDAETNPAIFVDEGESNNFVGCALFWNALTTETSFTIRVSTDNTFSAAEDVRTILTSSMTNGEFNFIRWNVTIGQFMQIRGASGSSLVLAINEIKSLTKTNSQILADLAILEISPTDTSLALDGT